VKFHDPGALPPGGRAPGTHGIGGWAGSRVGLDVVEKRNILYCRELNPGRLAHSPSVYPLLQIIVV
jgi:hypothetical protein